MGSQAKEGFGTGRAVRLESPAGEPRASPTIFSEYGAATKFFARECAGTPPDQRVFMPERKPDRKAQNQTASQTYTIGELAREFDVTPRAIRFYEDQGLLAPSRTGQTRVYSKRDYVRLKLTLRGKRLGFSLSEVGEMIDMYDRAKDEKKQLATFVALLAERRTQLLHQRAEIDEMLAEINAFEAQSRKILGKTGATGKPARRQS
jgi:DNA-binding transcriptional MerR regulator